MGLGINLNPLEQTDRTKRYYVTIKNCSECPFWSKCEVGGMSDDYRFPTGCMLRDWTGNENELMRVWRHK